MGDPLNILIISTGFPPRNAPGVLRPYSWAKYWTKAGHNVTVLTTFKSILDGPLDFSLEKNIHDHLRVVEVDLKFWRSSATKAQYHGKTMSVSGKNDILKKLKQLLGKVGRIRPVLDVYLLYLPLFVRAISDIIRHEKFDFMISTSPPGACHWIGHCLEKKFKIPWVADFRDPWGMPKEWRTRFSSLTRFVEKAAINRADLLMAVAPELQKELERRYAIPCVTVENGFDPEEFDGLDPEKIFPEDGKIRFVYTGKVYWQRNPAPFFAAVRELFQENKLAPLQIEILFYGRDSDNVSQMAREHDLDTIVKTPGLVERSIALRAQRDANGLLFLEGEYHTMDYVMPVKIFEYLRSGTPILGIGMTAASTAGKLMEDAGVGFPLGKDVNKIKEFILRQFIHQKSPSIKPNWQFINNFSREPLSLKALHYISDIISNN